MTDRVFNFAAGPSTLPLPVLQQVREELLNYQGLGASIIEMSHRAPHFEKLVAETEALFHELMDIPDTYKVLFAHGGAIMQMSAIPMNLIMRSPTKKAIYIDSGFFARRAIKEGQKYCNMVIAGSSQETNYDYVPESPHDPADDDAAFKYFTTNNTIMGTRFIDFPESGPVPLVGDATSEILSRPLDITRFGVLYAGAQKNLGPSGQAVVIIKKDLLGKAMPETPLLLNYDQLAQDNSLTNTSNVFAIYVINLVLNWLKVQGGVKEMEIQNERKAKVLYDVLDNSSFYHAYAVKKDRATMNATFGLPTEELDNQFIAEALENGLANLKGHKVRGGIRASIYNAMPEEGVNALAQFMEEFERKQG